LVLTLFKIIISPLLAASFIVSLFLVQRRDRAWRVSQHSSNANAHASFWSRWIDPEPYQESSKATNSGDGTTENDPMKENDKSKSWFIKKKHRKTAKYMIEDAWDRTGTVEVLIIGAAVVVVTGTAWGLKILYAWAVS
jgi:hypothetical protein